MVRDYEENGWGLRIVVLKDLNLKILMMDFFVSKIKIKSVVNFIAEVLLLLFYFLLFFRLVLAVEI